MGKKPRSDRSPVTKVQIRCEIKGEPAEFFLELKRRGIVASSRGAVVQVFSVSKRRSCRGICRWLSSRLLGD